MDQTGEYHYKIASTELAKWLEEQGNDRWWNVDGDPLLLGRVSFPCPSDELADDLRKLNRMLLVRDPRTPPIGKGEEIGADKLNDLTARLGDGLNFNGPAPVWVNDRLFAFCWMGSTQEWNLIEDEETSLAEQRDAMSPQEQPR